MDEIRYPISRSCAHILEKGSGEYFSPRSVVVRVHDRRSASPTSGYHGPESRKRSVSAHVTVWYERYCSACWAGIQGRNIPATEKSFSSEPQASPKKSGKLFIFRERVA